MPMRHERGYRRAVKVHGMRCRNGVEGGERIGTADWSHSQPSVGHVPSLLNVCPSTPGDRDSAAVKRTAIECNLGPISASRGIGTHTCAETERERRKDPTTACSWEWADVAFLSTYLYSYRIHSIILPTPSGER